MIASKIQNYLQCPKAKQFATTLKDNHVFGLGVSWNIEEQDLTSVRLVARDTLSIEPFKKFATTSEESAVVDFFIKYPHSKEDPNHGLHGNLFSLKINSKLQTKKAFYRRLDKTPISYEEAEWFRYSYEPFDDYPFNHLSFPEETSRIFTLETKSDFEGNAKGYCLYPKYGVIKVLGSMREGFEAFFDENQAHILKKFPQINLDIINIEERFDMQLVSLGETSGSIKAYFVDFEKNRLLLEGIKR